MRVRNVLLLALCILFQNIAHAHILPEVKKDIVVTKEEFLSVKVFENFADAFADARQWGRDFFIYKDIVYHPFTESEWVSFPDKEKARITRDCSRKAEAYTLVKEFWEKKGETYIYRWWFTDDEVGFDGRIFSPKGGAQTSDYCYDITFRIDLKDDRIKYLSEFMAVNPGTGRGLQTTINIDWIYYPSRGNDYLMKDFYVEPGRIAEKIRELLNKY